MDSFYFLRRGENTHTPKPLDIGYNIAVLAIARRLFPCGFDVRDDAPQTYDQLKAAFDANKPVVWSGASETTIYECPQVNYAFRAWHDWGHWHGKHPFTGDGERAVFEIPQQHLITVYGNCLQTDRWARILWAEVIGQHLYADRLGHYPKDQRAFVEAFMADPLMFEGQPRREALHVGTDHEPGLHP